jgi:hypothetical protein
MTQREMLKKLGVSKVELEDLLTKISNLQKRLTPNQRTLFQASLPTLRDAAIAFGPDVDPLEVENFFNKAHPTAGFGGIRLIVRNPQNEPPDGDS